MDSKRYCVLVSIDNTHDPIKLPHNEVVRIGRGPNTKITDKRCSRNQVELTADTNLLEVKLKHLGGNRVGVNGLAVQQNSSVTLEHGDRVELLLGQYINRVEFIPPPLQDEEVISSGKKRQLDNLDMPINKRLCGGTVNMAENSKACDVKNEPSTEDCWETIDNGKLLVYTAKGVEGRVKIAAYDIDGTIITTKSGRVFPVNSDDWKISYIEVPTKLKNLWKRGYKIVFLTNQAGISKGKIKPADFKNKVKEIIAKLDVPVQVFVSTGNGIYRKPAPGMWTALLEKKNNGVEVDMSQCFYCGDAAGREVNWAPKKKKDFSSSDRLLALNLGLKFYTPEEHFLGMQPAKFKLPDFNPSALSCNTPLCEPPDASITSDKPEVVLMVGFQGSGKSYFAATYLAPQGYTHVNRDVLGSWQRCITALETALTSCRSVVIDNTNPDRESRKRFIEIAAKHKVPCRCFVLTTSIQHAMHNNKFRELTDNTHMQITDMIINMYKKKYEEPSVDEGFSAVIKINCVPQISDPNMKKLYQMYLLEK